MASFNNIVTSDSGVPLAGFLSSIDARLFAQAEVDTGCYAFLTVSDYAGGVTKHTRGAPMEIIEPGVRGGSCNPFIGQDAYLCSAEDLVAGGPFPIELEA